MIGHRSYFNLGLGACLVASLSAVAADGPTVHVYNWYDYIGPNTLHDFKRDTGIQPVYDTFDSAEVLEGKLLTSRSGYDVVVASNFSLPTLIKAGALAPLPRAEMPDFNNMDTDLLAKLANNDPGNQYAVPYLWGTNGIGYNVDKVRAVLGDKAPVDSWDLVFKEENLAKLGECGVAMLDSPAEMLPVALHYLGKDPNSKNPADYEAATQLLLKLRPYVRKFHSSEYIEALANGDACVVIGYSGDILQARDRADEAKKGVEVGYFIPKEGSQVWFDVFTIPVDAPNPEAAYKFLDFMMRPEIIARASNSTNYANANLPATQLVKAEVRDDPNVYPTPEVFQRLFVTTTKDQALVRVVNREWTK
eukprot:gene13537-13320_t